MTNENYKSIIEFFDYAAIKLKFPKFVCHTKSGQVLRLQRAGEASRHSGALNITNDKPYGQNIWYGRIRRDGSYEPSRNVPWDTTTEHWEQTQREIRELLEQFAIAPMAFAAIQGKRQNFCCFCRAELTNPGSIHWGYGPICAENFGLPWTNAEPTDARDERVDNELEEAVAMQTFNFGKPAVKQVITPEPVDGKIAIKVSPPAEKPTAFTNNDKLLEKATNNFRVNLREHVATALNSAELAVKLEELVLAEWQSPKDLVAAIHDVTLDSVLHELNKEQG